MYNTLSNQRIRSIDAFRGITILVMIFVNDVAGVSNIPGWMKHKAADADAMTFVDVVFPAFLFIVGMSLPFALNNRIKKGDGFWKLQGHILWRTLGLLVLGVFMVNGEGSFNEKATGVSLAVWSLLFYGCAMLVWNVYSFKNKTGPLVLRLAGVTGLLVLGWIFRGGENGSERLSPRWWGILGLIGWAYLFSCIIYQLFRGRISLLLIAIAGCIAWYAVSRAEFARDVSVLQWMGQRAGHAAHTSIVLCGVVLSLIFFDEKKKWSISRRFLFAGFFAIAATIAARVLRPYYTISKIYATPSWCLYSVLSCIVLYCFLYWLIDRKGTKKWTLFFQPAASNPLLIYILPGIVMFVQELFHIYFTPASWHNGLPGIAWSACFAVMMMLLVMLLNKMKIRLHL